MGSWWKMEIQEALEIGYKILKIYEINHWVIHRLHDHILEDQRGKFWCRYSWAMRSVEKSLWIYSWWNNQKSWYVSCPKTVFELIAGKNWATNKHGTWICGRCENFKENFLGWLAYAVTMRYLPKTCLKWMSWKIMNLTNHINNKNVCMVCAMSAHTRVRLYQCLKKTWATMCLFWHKLSEIYI